MELEKFSGHNVRISPLAKIGENVKIIGASAFGDSPKLAKVTIPKTVWAIYPDAFTGTILVSVITTPCLNLFLSNLIITPFR